LKQGRNFDRKLARILRESAELFAKKRYDGASIRDISTITGISPSGLYYYFSSKAELLFLIQQGCIERLLERVTMDLDGVDAPTDRLAAVVRNHLSFFAENLAEMKVLSREGDSLSAVHAQEIARLRREYSDLAQACVCRLAPSAPDDVHRIATLALLGMVESVWTSHAPSEDLSVETIGSIILALFLDGVRSSSASVRPKSRPGPVTTDPVAWGPQ